MKIELIISIYKFKHNIEGIICSTQEYENWQPLHIKYKNRLFRNLIKELCNDGPFDIQTLLSVSETTGRY